MESSLSVGWAITFLALFLQSIGKNTLWVDPATHTIISKRGKEILFSQYQGIISIKSGGNSQFSLSFLSFTVNDVRRKLYEVVIHSTVGKRAKQLLDTTVETTHLHYPTNIVFTAFLVARGLLV